MYFFRMVCDLLSRPTGRIAGFGEGTPQQDSRRGKNKRRANFGTSVESCSKKLPLSSAALVCGYTGLLHQYSDCGGVFCPLFTTTTVKKVRFGKCSGNFFDFPVLLPTTIRRCGLPKIFENRRKKSSKPFSDLLLVCAAVMGGGYSVVSGGDTRLKRNLNNAFSSVSVMKSSASLSACPLIREA